MSFFTSHVNDANIRKPQWRCAILSPCNSTVEESSHRWNHKLLSSRATASPHVETFGPLNESAEETRRLLDRHGLAAVSGHVSLDQLETNTTFSIHAARALGVEFVVAPYLSSERRPGDRAGWVAFGSGWPVAATTSSVRDCASPGTTMISNSSSFWTAHTGDDFNYPKLIKGDGQGV
jgi:hypothetical protein